MTPWSGIPDALTERPANAGGTALGTLATTLRRFCGAAVAGAVVGALIMTTASALVTPQFTAEVSVQTGWLGAFRPTIVDSVRDAMDQGSLPGYAFAPGVSHSIVPMSRTRVFIRTYASSRDEAFSAAQAVAAAYVGELNRLTVVELGARAQTIDRAIAKARADWRQDTEDLSGRARRSLGDLRTLLSATLDPATAARITRTGFPSEAQWPEIAREVMASSGCDGLTRLLTQVRGAMAGFADARQHLDVRRRQLDLIASVSSMITVGLQFVPISITGAGETLEEAATLARTAALLLPEDQLPDGTVLPGGWSAAFGQDIPHQLGEASAAIFPVWPRRNAWISVGVIFGAIAGLLVAVVGERTRWRVAVAS